MRRKKQEQEAPASGDRRITPVDIQQVEFRLAFRGYNERDVDAFLDRITEDLSSYLEEVQRLRAGAGSPLLAAGEAPDAEGIVARAREEAAAIVRRAEEDAAAIRAAAGAGDAVGVGDTRAVMAPFLGREREFLQSLGTLVQGHAEEIKQMVLALRARSEAAAGSGPETDGGSSPQAPAPSAPASADTPTLAPEALAVQARASTNDRDEGALESNDRDERPSTSPTELTEMTPASTSEIADRLGMPPVAPRDGEGSQEQEEAEPIVVESSTEPVFSSEGAPAGERRERSLRELFWGED